jgi:hypothetical protein
MLIFDLDSPCHSASLAVVLERLKALVADMEAVQAGTTPPSLSDDAPLLDDWRDTETYRPVWCLTGRSSGHPLLPGAGRMIITSDLHLISRDGRFARTASRWYRLGDYRQVPNDDLDTEPGAGRKMQ